METYRCKLNELQESDYEVIIHLYSNELVRKYLGGAIKEKHDLRMKFQEDMKRASEGSSLWVVNIKSNNEFIGLISLCRYHDGIHTEVSYELMPDYWGQGYGTELIEWLIQYAFNEKGADQLIAETQTANKSSCRLLEKVGMRLERVEQRYGAEQGIYCIKSPRKSLRK